MNSFRWLELFSLPTLITGLLYTTGWSYAYHYFDYFNVGLLSLETPGQYFFMYGFWVLNDLWKVSLAFLALMIVSFLVLRHGIWPRLPDKIKNVLALFKETFFMVILPALVLLVFIGSYYMASQTAESFFAKQQEAGFVDYPRVRIWLKEDENEKETNKEKHKIWQFMEAELSSKNYRLLLQTKEELLVFYAEQINQKVNSFAARPAVLHIPLGEVRAFNVIPRPNKAKE